MKSILRTLFNSPRGRLLAVGLLVMSTPAVVFGYNQISQPDQTAHVQSQPASLVDEPTTPTDQPNDEASEVTDSPAKAILSHQPSSVTVERLSGKNAVDTSVAVSKKYYKSNVSVVYIAERWAYADSIVAGTMRTKGPILYVNKTELPSSVGKELQRLKPKKVIIVGGSDVVSETVRKNIKSKIPSSSSVERLSGKDRYLTAVSVSKSQYKSGANTVYITNGTAYPDSIAATQQKAAGPLLYTRKDSVLTQTTNEIKRLKAKNVVIIGDNSVVSTQVANKISSRTKAKVTRVGGDDRYETAAKLSRSLYPKGVSQVFIAEGTAYADSILISSIPKSGALLYTRTDSIPDSTMVEIQRLKANRATIIGGAVRVSEPVSKQIKQIMTGTQLKDRLSKGITYFALAHPDDEVSSWAAIDNSTFPVFILMTQGENSGFCDEYGGRGSGTCKAKRVNSFHSFLNNYYSVKDKGRKNGYRLYLGKDSARLIFDLGDGKLTTAKVTEAINKARQVDYGVTKENYVAAGSYWNDGRDPHCDPKKSDYVCGHYDHSDHRAVSKAVTAYNYPNRLTVHGYYNSTVTAGIDMGKPLFNSMMHCTKGTYNKAYSWLRPPCWNPDNARWSHWHWYREY